MATQAQLLSQTLDGIAKLRERVPGYCKIPRPNSGGFASDGMLSQPPRQNVKTTCENLPIEATN